MKLNKKNLQIITRDLFITLFVLFNIFIILELIKPKIVLAYINLELHLILLLVLGGLTVMFFPLNQQQYQLKFWTNLLILLISIFLGILIIYLTREIGWLSSLIGLVSALIIYLFIISNLKGR